MLNLDTQYILPIYVIDIDIVLFHPGLLIEQCPLFKCTTKVFLYVVSTALLLHREND